MLWTYDDPGLYWGFNISIRDGKNKAAIVNKSPIYKDDVLINLMAYTISDNDYFKLRDLAQAFNIGIFWDDNNKTISIDTTVSVLWKLKIFKIYPSLTHAQRTRALDRVLKYNIRFEILLDIKQTRAHAIIKEMVNRDIIKDSLA